MRTILLTLTFSTLCPAAAILFTPGAMVHGQAGDFAGWGYVLSDNRGYSVPTFSEFNPAPDDGLYIDFVSLPSNFVIIVPVAPGGQFFNPAQQTGLGEFFIDPATPDNTVINGTITLHYDLYSNNPDLNPDSFLSGDNTISADVSITVTGLDAAANAPEPGTLGLVLGGLALALLSKQGRGHALC